MTAGRSLLVSELCETVWRDPGEGADWAARLTTSAEPRVWSALMIDVHLLRVEALVRAGQLDEAVGASVDAGRAAGESGPREWPRLITALMLGCDVSVLAGFPHAVAACDSTRHAFSYLKEPDLVRASMVAGLHAVAVFHHVDAGHGRWLLEGVLRDCGEAAAVPVLARGLAAMNGDTAVAPRAVPPVPGGLLCPSPDERCEGWLASRVLSRHSLVPGVA